MDRLTSLSHGAGCACKMPLAQLEVMLAGLAPASDDRLLVGPALGDDAAVWDDGHGDPLVVTTDFFTPVVDDARDWGRIAAANAASDVYAMGGVPLLALNLVGWPRQRPVDEIRSAMDGAAEVASTGGWLVVGGHTIDLGEPIFGQAVVGRVPREQVMTNAGARVGDALVLTKALGTGVVMTAAKRERVEAVQASGWLARAHRAAVTSMTTLNRDAAMAALEHGARAATDVTGFGLLGHLVRMGQASGVAAEVVGATVPVLPDVRGLVEQGHVPGGTRTNLEHARQHVDGDLDAVQLTILADAQTSGGLLVALEPDAAEALARTLAEGGHAAAVIGRVVAGDPGTITIR